MANSSFTTIHDKIEKDSNFQPDVVTDEQLISLVIENGRAKHRGGKRPVLIQRCSIDDIVKGDEKDALLTIMSVKGLEIIYKIRTVEQQRTFDDQSEYGILGWVVDSIIVIKQSASMDGRLPDNPIALYKLHDIKNIKTHHPTPLGDTLDYYLGRDSLSLPRVTRSVSVSSLGMLARTSEGKEEKKSEEVRAVEIRPGSSK